MIIILFIIKVKTYQLKLIILSILLNHLNNFNNPLLSFSFLPDTCPMEIIILLTTILTNKIPQ